MNFPLINNISDVLPHIEDSNEFVIIDKGEYTVIDYVFESNETFPRLDEGLKSFVRRECRGISFDKDGKIIRRGLQKFFNVGQNEESSVSNINWEAPHTLMDKRDGSLIYYGYLNDRNFCGTRKGETDVALMADRFVKNKDEVLYGQFIEYMKSINQTAFFEFSSLENIIVIDYIEPCMVALSSRDINSGEYLSQPDLESICNKFNVPFVDTFDIDISKPNDFLLLAKKEVDKEGYVIRFDNGYSVKVKSDWYFDLHKCVSQINQKLSLSKLILNGDIDDVVASIPEQRVKSVRDFESRFWKFYNRIVDTSLSKYNKIVEKSKKDWVRRDWAEIIKLEEQPYMGILFSLLNDDSDENLHNSVKSLFQNRLQKQKTFDDFCEQMGEDLSI